MKSSSREDLPVAIIGSGPVGMITALGLAHYGIPAVIYEDDQTLSLDTKAGTILTRTLEILRRYDAVDEVLAGSLRVDEIGEIDRKTQKSTFPVFLDALADETAYPFVINMPQHYLEPILQRVLKKSALIKTQMGHRLEALEQKQDHVELTIRTAEGTKTERASFVLACDGGRSTVRDLLGIRVDGHSLPVRYSLVDLEVDLDTANPRDYPYLTYFSDAEEWMILVRHPHCWRFLYPLQEGVDEPTAEELREKSLRFIGDVDQVKVINKVTYRVHHRVATQWRSDRVFLMGDAAHLITPMWALGLNTGALDASNLPWRLAWYLRGWADESILDGYEREQKPLAVHGSGEMAEAARHSMEKRGDISSAMSESNWRNAYTRTMLGVKLDVVGTTDWSMVARSEKPACVAGDRLPNHMVHTAKGQESRLHDICRGRFTALYFADARRRPSIPTQSSPALQHLLVSRYDAPLDSGLRDRSLLDPGGALARRVGCELNTLVLVRPDEHIAFMVPMNSDPHQAEKLYQQITGSMPPEESTS